MVFFTMMLTTDGSSTFPTLRKAVDRSLVVASCSRGGFDLMFLLGKRDAAHQGAAAEPGSDGSASHDHRGQ